MPKTSTAGYGEQASALVVQYESITFEDVHRDVLHLLLAPPARIVDVGAAPGAMPPPWHGAAITSWRWNRPQNYARLAASCTRMWISTGSTTPCPRWPGCANGRRALT
jgi:hypothetical protein